MNFHGNSRLKLGNGDIQDEFYRSESIRWLAFIKLRFRLPPCLCHSIDGGAAEMNDGLLRWPVCRGFHIFLRLLSLKRRLGSMALQRGAGAIYNVYTVVLLIIN